MNRLATALGYAMLCCAALAQAQLPGPLFERPLRKDPVIIPAAGGAGLLTAVGEQVQLSVTRGLGLSDRALSIRLSAADGTVLDSRRGTTRNADGVSFVAELTGDGRTCLGRCNYLGNQIEGYDAEDRPLWRSYGLFWATAELRTNAFSPALIANGDARSPSTGVRLLDDPDCMLRAPLRGGNLLSCRAIPSQIKLVSPRGQTLWSVDGVRPQTLVISPNGARLAVVAEDGSVRVLAADSGASQLGASANADVSRLLWATDERLYARAGSEVIAYTGSSPAISESWRRPFAELGSRPGLEGADALGRLYLSSASSDALTQVSFDGTAVRPALNYSRYQNTFRSGPQRFARTVVETIGSELRGIDRDTGVERWRIASLTAPLPQQTTAAVLGDRVFVASVATVANNEVQLRMDSFDSDGLPLTADLPFQGVTLEPGASSTSQPWLQPPVASGANVLLSALYQGRRIVAAYSTTGRRLWQREIPETCTTASPTVQGSQTFVVVGLDALKGQPIPSNCIASVLDARTGASVRSVPNLILLGDTGNALVPGREPSPATIVDVATGNPLITLPAGKPVAVDALGERIVLLGANRTITSVRFDGSVVTSFTLPIGITQTFFALDRLLLAEVSDDTFVFGTLTFELDTGNQRFGFRSVSARANWKKVGDRWIAIQGRPIRQFGQRVVSNELNPLTGEFGFRVLGFSNAHSHLYADEVVGELPGRALFLTRVVTYDRGMLTGWALPARLPWADEIKVDLKVRELGRTRTADGGLLIRMHLSNAGPNGAQQAVLSAALIEDQHRVTVASCTASLASCPAIGAAPPFALDLPAGASADIEFAISGSAAPSIDSASRERLLVSLFPRAEELESHPADNENAALLYDGIFRDTFEN